MKVKVNLSNQTLEYMDSQPYIQGTDTRNKLDVYIEHSSVPQTEGAFNIMIAYALQNGRTTIKMANTGATQETIDDVLYDIFYFTAPKVLTSISGNFVATLILKVNTNTYKVNVLNTVLNAVDFEAFEDALDDVSSEFIETIEAMSTNITDLQVNKLDKTAVYNGLDQVASGYVLDARQGKVLKDSIDSIQALENLSNIVGTYSELQSLIELGEPTTYQLNAKVQVLNDSIHDGNSTLYNLDSLDIVDGLVNNFSWGFVGYYDGYNKEQIDTIIDNFEQSVNDNFDELSRQVEGTLEQQTETIEGLGQLQPSGTDTSTNILAFNEDKGIYIGTDTGNWYYWNGTQYISGGTYQSTDLIYGLIAERNLTDNDFDEISIRSTNLYDSTKKINGYVDIVTGVDTSSDSVNSSNYIACKPSTNYCWSPSTFWISFYDINKVFISSSTQGQSNPITTPNNCYFLRINFLANSTNVRINEGSTLESYQDYTPRKIKDSAINIDTTLTQNGVPADSKAVGDRFKMVISQNWLDNTNMVNDKIMWETGVIQDLANYSYTANYSPITPNTEYLIHFRNNVWMCFYDSNKQYLSGRVFTGGETTATFTTPNNAYYLRVSYLTANTYRDYINLGSVDLGYSEYEFYGYVGKGIDGYLGIKTTKVVDVNGSGDFTSLTEALYTTNDDLLVKVGVYDIVEEYKTLFGNDVWSTMTDSTTTMNNFQLGLYINNRKVEFEVGAKVVCDLTDSGYTVLPPSKRFSLFFIGQNATLINVNAEATRTYYLMHDDTNNAVLSSFTNEYDNCIFKGTTLYSPNVIGGGTHNGGRFILNNCYISNGLGANYITMRYHGTDTPNSRSEVIISNCKIEGRIGINWYGNTTCEMLCKIHNNEMGGAIDNVAENPDWYPTNNTIIYEWNNTIIQ